MSNSAKIIKMIKQDEAEHQLARELVNMIRDSAKTDGGRLTEYGRNFIKLCNDNGWKQSDIARILEITPGAVSQNLNK